jgi:hypothetical protein
MERRNLEGVVDRWAADPDFRSALRADPEAALASAGLVLNPEEREALSALDWSLPDHQLEQRISKSKDC